MYGNGGSSDATNWPEVVRGVKIAGIVVQSHLWKVRKCHGNWVLLVLATLTRDGPGQYRRWDKRESSASGVVRGAVVGHFSSCPGSDIWFPQQRAREQVSELI
jgi:hypothetical protein